MPGIKTGGRRWMKEHKVSPSGPAGPVQSNPPFCEFDPRSRECISVKSDEKAGGRRVVCSCRPPARTK